MFTKIIILHVYTCITLYRALWAADEKRDMCLQLDPTEGPQRVRRRMMRAPTSVHEKHLLPEGIERRRKKDDGVCVCVCVCVCVHSVYTCTCNRSHNYIPHCYPQVP